MLPLVWGYWLLGMVFIITVCLFNPQRNQRETDDIKPVPYILLTCLLGWFWPLLVLVFLHTKLFPYEQPKQVPFTVEFADLSESLTLQQIENKHYVFDPAEAVPFVPFGFLNTKWRRFSHVQQDEFGAFTFWSFAKLDQSGYWPELTKGYAKVNSQQEVVDYFIYEIDSRG
jgi:hypothetical protein